MSAFLFDEIIALRMAATALPPGPGRARLDSRLDRIAGLALIDDMERSGDLPPETAEAERARIAARARTMPACQEAGWNASAEDPRLHGLERRAGAIEAALTAERPARRPARAVLQLVHDNPVARSHARLEAAFTPVPGPHNGGDAGGGNPA